MELHKAIKEIIDFKGPGIITDTQIINFLLDYNAFYDVPASRTIVQSMIATGYSQKILDLGGHNCSIKESDGTFIIKLKGYIDSFCKQNGFHIQLVDYVVKCVVYGLGWIEEVPAIPDSQSTLAKQTKTHSIQPLIVKSGTTSGRNTNKTDSITYQNIVDSQFLVIKVSPQNASVFIDGQQQFVSYGIMAVELSIGQHTYVVKAENYETKSGYVEIKSDNKTEIAVALSLEKKYVELTIETADIDADILINGKTYGKGKWEGLVEEGTYEIEAIKYRYYPYKQTISLYGIDKEKISIPLLKGIYGNLKVNVQPYGSGIHINNEYMGDTPLLIKDILIGERNLTILTKEVKLYKTTVEIKENQTTEINHIIPSSFLFDYSEVRLGDYFYEDGSFSHEKVSGKKIVGVVFNLNPSEEEKKNGWTHGQIIAVKNAKGPTNRSISWGIATKEMLENAVVNPAKDFNSRDNGYMLTHMDSVLNNPDFEPFILAAEHEDKLPFGITSGWYLPCIAQWRILHENLHTKLLYDKFLKLEESYKNRKENFATSSLFDEKEAWKYEVASYAKEGYYHKAKISFYAELSYLEYDRIRAVASF